MYFDKTFLAPKYNLEGSHVVLSNVQKESKTKYLNLDTRFQEEYNFAKYAECLCLLPQAIRAVTAISAVQIEIPFSFFNFSAAKGNNSFNFSNESHDFTISVEDNVYDTQSLVQIINEMQSDLSFAIVDHRIQITNTEPVTLSWNVDKTHVSKYALKSRLGWCLGFRQPTYDLPAHSTLTAEAICNVNTTRYLYLILDEFSAMSPNTFTTPLANSYINRNVLARIEIDPSVHVFGGVITNPYYLASDRRCFSSPIDIQKLKIQVADEWGNLVHLNGLDFSFCLKIEYE